MGLFSSDQMMAMIFFNCFKYKVVSSQWAFQYNHYQTVGKLGTRENEKLQDGGTHYDDVYRQVYLSMKLVIIVYYSDKL